MTYEPAKTTAVRSRRAINWRRIGLIAGGVVLAGAVSGFALVAFLTRDLPDAKWLKSYEPPVTSRVHAGDGRLIAEFAREHRVFVPYEELPPHLVEAFVSAEDKNFFNHWGIDLLGMMRGGGNILKSALAGDISLQSGSTITQQVAKNMLLTSDQTIERKVREVFLSLKMEGAPFFGTRILSKERIMELYLNEIFLGNRSFGVAAATLNYFNKSLADLTIAEAALLASLPQAPSRYDPARNPEVAFNRRNWVIGRMQTNGYITNEEAEAAQAEPIQTVRRFAGAEFEASNYFVEELRRSLLVRLEQQTAAADPKLTEEEVRKAAEEKLYNGGLSIRSTLDTRLQLAAQSALRRGLEAYDRRQGWRGPVARIDSELTGEALTVAFKDVERPRGSQAEWKLARVTASSGERVNIQFQDGIEGRLAAEDAVWARDRYKGPKDQPKGLKVGDVVLASRVAAEEPVDDAAALARTAGDKETKGNTYRLNQIPEAEGALVAMDPHTGRVLAMAGGYSFNKSQFNRATQAQRQPGSSFKPFVYAAALELGATPSTLVLDAPFVNCDPTQPECWRPQNYSEEFYGPSTLRLGIEKSRNVMTVRLVTEIGMQPVVEIARRFGIYDNLQPYLAMSLGSGETTLMKVTSAYAMLVNGGKQITPSLYDRLQNRYGETIDRRDERACNGCSVSWKQAGALPPMVPDVRKQIMDPVVAYQSVSMLEGVVKRGTAQRVAAVGKPLAGKTGTTNDYLDAWMVGFSPDLVAGIWVGFDTPRTLGRGESGGRVATPIFRDFMAEALKDAPDTPFRIPSGVRLVEIDARSGQLANADTAVRILEAFRPGTEPRLGFEQDGGDFSISGTGLEPEGPAPQPGQPTPTPSDEGLSPVY